MDRTCVYMKKKWNFIGNINGYCAYRCGVSSCVKKKNNS